jgi:hypothetical protein
MKAGDYRQIQHSLSIKIQLYLQLFELCSSLQVLPAALFLANLHH